jgi:hypothetical protein
MPVLVSSAESLPIGAPSSLAISVRSMNAQAGFRGSGAAEVVVAETGAGALAAGGGVDPEVDGAGAVLPQPAIVAATTTIATARYCSFIALSRFMQKHRLQ